MQEQKQKLKGIWTKISPEEHAAFSFICVKRSLSCGERVTLRSLLRQLVKEEIVKAIELGEIDPDEFGVLL